MLTVYRSAQSAADTSEGSCWTTCRSDAESYYGTLLITAELDDSNALDVPGYDREANETPADSRAQRDSWAEQGATVVRYDDESVDGQAMETYRLVGHGEVIILSVENN